jgi:hypothetical protein
MPKDKAKHAQNTALIARVKAFLELPAPAAADAMIDAASGGTTTAEAAAAAATGATSAAASSAPPPHLHDAFDLILLDPPCSGFGLRPRLVGFEAPHALEVALSGQYQLEMLLGCARQLARRGGRISYSTCTTSWHENERNVLAALSVAASAYDSLGRRDAPAPPVETEEKQADEKLSSTSSAAVTSATTIADRYAGDGCGVLRLCHSSECTDVIDATRACDGWARLAALADAAGATAAVRRRTDIVALAKHHASNQQHNAADVDSSHGYLVFRFGPSDAGAAPQAPLYGEVPPFAFDGVGFFLALFRKE